MMMIDLTNDISDLDFVTREGDYDFPLYLSEREEWVNDYQQRVCKGSFLIMELYRFVPYLDDLYIKFHPINMPNHKIGLIEIAGQVLHTNESVNYHRYIVDDGTGIINIYFKKSMKAVMDMKRKQIDETYIKHLSSGTIDVDLLEEQICPNKFPKIRPGFKYPAGTSIEDAFIFEHNWSLETNGGTLGIPINRCMYVLAKGYCSLNFLTNKRPTDEMLLDDLSILELTFIAMKVTVLTEHQYNKKILSWMQTDVQKRYNQGPIEEFTNVRAPVFNTIM